MHFNSRIARGPESARGIRPGPPDRTVRACRAALPRARHAAMPRARRGAGIPLIIIEFAFPV